MKREVLIYNQIEGLHNYPDAGENVSYLSNIHRHVFVIRCRVEVLHNNREVEIITSQNEIKDYLYKTFGEPCDFGTRSCEDIAECLLKAFSRLSYVEVLEDGYGGAALTR